MALVDWLIVAAFLAFNVGIGLWFSRRAGKSVDDFFVGGRSMPWWLAGTAILTGSFASDTPLQVTKMIREKGLGGAWFYWGGILGGVLVALVFARLWKRTGVVTDNELMELRYTGRPAAVLRGSMAIFKSLVLEVLTMAWITVGMTKIVTVVMDLPEAVLVPGIGPIPSDVLVVGLLLVFAAIFCTASGFWGVVATDLLEFGMAMTGAIVLGVVAYQKVGGFDGLREGLKQAPLGERTLDVMPQVGLEGFTFLAVGVYFGVQWWAHGGADGSGHRAQRFLAAKDERNAIASGLWSLAITWIIRSWPWYIAALASLVLYPTIVDGETVYPRMVVDLLPVGLKGLMVASFVSAFMGTMESHYNLTASYAVNDVYKRFIARDRSSKHYVRASRWATILIATLAGGVALTMSSVLEAFQFKMELMSGLGLIYVLRWFWWRVNATMELVALVTSAAAALTFKFLPATSGGGTNGSATRLLLVVAVSGAAAIATAWVTRPEPTAHLVAFYRRVRPPGWWGPIAREAGGKLPSGFGLTTLGQAATSLIFVLGCMIGLGKMLLGEPVLGAALFTVGLVCGVVTIRAVLRSKSEAELAAELAQARVVRTDPD
jgi:solute:Na+ symporter, SSS family